MRPTITSLRSTYLRRQTLYEHQRPKEYLGLNDIDQADNDRLVAYLGAQASEVISVDEKKTKTCAADLAFRAESSFSEHCLTQIPGVAESIDRKA